MYFYINDFSMYYKKYGTGPQNIIILPGWGNTRNTFSHIIKYLENDYTIYIMDYPGFGNSSFPDNDLTIYDYGKLIYKFIKHLGIENPYIIAHSFGCRVATILISYYKLKVKKLILMSSAAIKERKSIKQIIKQSIYKLLRKLDIFIPKLKKELFHQRLYLYFASTDYNNLNIIMRNTFKNIINTNLKRELKDISCETLILWGENDLETHLKYGLITKKQIKNSEIIIFEKGDHFFYLKYNITSIILAFFKAKEE